MSPTFRHPDGTSYHVDHEPDNDGKGYPIRWVDFGQPRLQLVVPPWFDALCRAQGTTPQEVYDRGLGPPCDVQVYDPEAWERAARPPAHVVRRQAEVAFRHIDQAIMLRALEGSPLLEDRDLARRTAEQVRRIADRPVPFQTGYRR